MVHWLSYSDKRSNWQAVVRARRILDNAITYIGDVSSSLIITKTKRQNHFVSEMNGNSYYSTFGYYTRSSFKE